jgi:hypothetical protein
MAKRVPCPECRTNIIDARAARCFACRYGQTGFTPAVISPLAALPTPAEAIAADREKVKSANALRSANERYREALATIERLELELGVTKQLQSEIASYDIGEPAATLSTPAEATVIAVASDWHYEESVGAEVGGLNFFNRDVATSRIQRFFRKVHSLTNMLAQDITIDTIVLALLGDFITNDIHGGEEAEANSAAPMHALVEVQNHIVAGIDYLLKNSDRNLLIPCHSGNHARTTKTTRFHTENGHSLEYLLFKTLEMNYRNESRVTFLIAEGPHSYVDIQGLTVRFQHGHMVKYGGGVGGIYIPVHKAIAQWNKAKHADLDVFGHFHQLVDGGNFVCNGSLIGYNSFALSIKASYEKPKQTLILVDNKRGRTALWPIYV